MAEINLVNKDILEKLNYVKDNLLDHPNIKDENKRKQFEKYVSLMSKEQKQKGGEYFTSSRYFLTERENVQKYRPLDRGFPFQGLDLDLDNAVRYTENSHIWEYCKRRLAPEVGASSCSLFSLYPPGGYVGWHTNENNPGYQFILSWSEKGDGYFKYYDYETKSIITEQDKKGWQARHYYFAHPNEKDKLCWHAMFTNCLRLTVCVKINNGSGIGCKENEIAMEIRDQLVEDMETE